MSNQDVLEEVERQTAKYQDVVINGKIMPDGGYEDEDGLWHVTPEYVEVRFGKPFLNLVSFDDELGACPMDVIADVVHDQIEQGVRMYRKHRARK